MEMTSERHPHEAVMTQYDELFTTVAQQCGSIDNLLTSFFGFLKRRSDFYTVYDKSKGIVAKSGFLKGEAEKLVLKALHSYQFIDYEEKEIVSKHESKHNSVIEVVEKDLMNNKKDFEIPKGSIKNMGSVQKPVGNGGIGPNYTWTQTLNDLSVFIDVDNNAKGKDFNCKIGDDKIHIKYKEQVVLDGIYEEKIKSNESMWTLIRSQDNLKPAQIVISLEKIRKTWWKQVIVGHPEINTSQVDSTQKVEDYDPETQSAIRKIVYEQRIKLN